MNKINSAVATNKQAAVSAAVLETGRMAGEINHLQAWWFDVTMHLLKYFPRLSQRRDASQGPL